MHDRLPRAAGTGAVSEIVGRTSSDAKPLAQTSHRPRVTAGLGRHACLSYSYLPSGDVWQFTNRKGEKQSVRIKGPLSANNGDALDDALKHGLGLALQPDFIAWHGLQDGTLERVLTDWAAPPLAVNILTPAGGTRPSRVTAQIEFLVQHFAAEAVPWAALK